MSGEYQPYGRPRDQGIGNLHQLRRDGRLTILKRLERLQNLLLTYVQIEAEAHKRLPNAEQEGDHTTSAYHRTPWKPLNPPNNQIIKQTTRTVPRPTPGP